MNREKVTEQKRKQFIAIETEFRNSLAFYFSVQTGWLAGMALQCWGSSPMCMRRDGTFFFKACVFLFFLLLQKPNSKVYPGCSHIMQPCTSYLLGCTMYITHIYMYCRAVRKFTGAKTLQTIQRLLRPLKNFVKQWLYLPSLLGILFLSMHFFCIFIFMISKQNKPDFLAISFLLIFCSRTLVAIFHRFLMNNLNFTLFRWRKSL